jgi:hypothetical protein
MAQTQLIGRLLDRDAQVSPETDLMQAIDQLH